MRTEIFFFEKRYTKIITESGGFVNHHPSKMARAARKGPKNAAKIPNIYKIMKLFSKNPKKGIDKVDFLC